MNHCPMGVFYPSRISGFRAIECRSIFPGTSYCKFRTTTAFSPQSSEQLFILLPENLEINYPDPIRSDESELVAVCIRKVGQGYLQCIADLEGWSSPWAETELERIVSEFTSSCVYWMGDQDVPAFTVYTGRDYSFDKYSGTKVST
ncbi:MAG: hypothetical protein EOP84_21355 [Verrucomicrobiaceae bacterium]|nr:MAG: hypothetical protein EOP84_21355 [Verrucomicrobiaceae bacterium]